MDAYQHAKAVLTTAYYDETLRSGSYCTCAVSRLIDHALGYPDSDWGDALVAHVYGLPVMGDHAIGYYATLLGMTPGDLVAIEGAFEGFPMTPGVIRNSMGSDEALEDRLERVFYTLDSLSARSLIPA